METKKFIFVPDGHYGYPITEDGDTPYDYDTLVKEYCGSFYSAWNQGDFDVDEEPDADDYETSEEYDEAYAEWEESQSSNKEYCYAEYGSFDVFRNSYEMLANPDIDPNDILNEVFDYSGTSCHDDFMQEAAVTEGVAFVISRGSDDEIAIAGKVYPLNSDSQEKSEMLADTIVNEYRINRSVKAGIMYKVITDNIPGVKERIAAKLSPEEMLDIEDIGKGGSTLRNFGFGV